MARSYVLLNLYLIDMLGKLDTKLETFFGAQAFVFDAFEGCSVGFRIRSWPARQ
jgi:hypothetical protein